MHVSNWKKNCKSLKPAVFNNGMKKCITLPLVYSNEFVLYGSNLQKDFYILLWSPALFKARKLTVPLQPAIRLES